MASSRHSKKTIFECSCLHFAICTTTCKTQKKSIKHVDVWFNLSPVNKLRDNWSHFVVNFIQSVFLFFTIPITLWISPTCQIWAYKWCTPNTIIRITVISDIACGLQHPVITAVKSDSSIYRYSSIIKKSATKCEVHGRSWATWRYWYRHAMNKTCSWGNLTKSCNNLAYAYLYTGTTGACWQSKSSFRVLPQI